MLPTVVTRPTFARSLIRSLQIGSRPLIASRTYASKKGKAKEKDRKKDTPLEHTGPKGSVPRSTENLIPTSQRALQDDAAQQDYDKSSLKMAGTVDWLRKEIASLTARGLGHVTTSILDPVKVVLPDSPDPVKLQEVATLGVRDGSNIIVTLFDDNYSKPVENAIYSAKLPGVVPQKVDARTLKVVIPRPTVEARSRLLKDAGKLAEDSKVQIRKIRDAIIRKHNWKSRTDSEELEQFQKLVDKYVKEVDQLLSSTKQQLG